MGTANLHPRTSDRMKGEVVSESAVVSCRQPSDCGIQIAECGLKNGRYGCRPVSTLTPISLLITPRTRAARPYGNDVRIKSSRPQVVASA